MLVVGSMMEFYVLVSSDMVRQVGSAGWLIAMWVLQIIITLLQVSYGELSLMFPTTGVYVYIKRHNWR
jgi:APA family basic amino acid/polyamine antiporter